jgi:hypothetical protein
VDTDGFVPWRFRGPPPPFAARLVQAETSLAGTAKPIICRLEALDKETRLGCSTGGEPLWSHAWRSDGRTAALLPLATDLAVAFYSPIASGAELRAYDLRTGGERFRTPLQGLGPIAHSQYYNGVELDVEPGGKIAVFGNEAGGKYVEIVDFASGRTLSVRKAEEPRPRIVNDTTPAPVPSTTEPWADAGNEPLVAADKNLERTLSAPGGVRCKLFTKKSPTESPSRPLIGFRCEDGKKALIVEHETADASSLAENAAIADVNGQPLFVIVRYNAHATGATLAAYDLTSGTLRYAVPLVGIGDVSHSKYNNDVRLVVRGSQVIVYGKESQGSYVEVLDAASGRLLGNRRI